MADRRKYQKRQGASVTAVQLDLETEGFSYRKWGGEQRCRAGDWIVNNGGEVYTVAADSFAATYRELSPGVYEKVSQVWAEQAVEPGRVKTKEGETRYDAGDYLVANNADGSDAYAIEQSKFEALYEAAE